MRAFLLKGVRPPQYKARRLPSLIPPLSSKKKMTILQFFGGGGVVVVGHVADLSSSIRDQTQAHSSKRTKS